MTKYADITYQQAKFIITGELSFATVMSVYEKSLFQLNQAAEFDFDFSRVKESDSSGLALILEWMRLARQRQKPIHFTSIPKGLLAIAKAAGLEEVVALVA